MKASKRFSAWLLLMATAMLLLPTGAMATSITTFEVNDIKYKILSETEKTVQVGDGRNPAIAQDYRDTLIIPGEVTHPTTDVTYTVVAIGFHAFWNCLLNEIHFPADITAIDLGALEGCRFLYSLFFTGPAPTVTGDASDLQTTLGGLHYYADYPEYSVRFAQKLPYGPPSGWGFYPSYTISATAGEGGSIQPPGVTWKDINYAPPEYAIMADAGYKIADVKVDGASKGPLDSYNFEAPLTRHHTIEATFALAYAVTVESGTGGGDYIEGATVTLTADTPPAGKRFKTWAFSRDIALIGSVLTDAEISFAMPGEAVTATATYENIPTFNISYNANGGTGKMPIGTATEGVPFVIPECGFKAPEGKRFKAWAIDEPSGMNFAPGDDLRTFADAEFFALWEDIPAVPTADPALDPPKTGDAANSSLWLCLLFAAAVGLIALERIPRKFKGK